MGRVWVVGSCNVDLPWRVARHPQVGETIVGEALDRLPGGKGLNQAVAAARMGVDVSLVGCVGEDEAGAWLRATARQEGIDDGAVSVAAGASTGQALIVVDADGANTVTVDAGANGALVVGELAVGVGDVVVAQLEVPTDAVAAAFDRARWAGATCLLNPSPVGEGRSLVGDVDVVVVNELEAAELAAELDPARQVVVATLGERGVRWAGPSGSGAIGGVAVAAVDTTGAGDCFLGVLAAGLAEGWALERAIDRANRAAARSTTRHGTVPAMPRADELDQGAP